MTGRRRVWRAIVAILALALAMLPFQAAPAAAAPALSVTPITFDVIGLDSNNTAVGPNLYPVGARICNTGDVTLTNATATLVFEGATNPYLTVVGPTVINAGTLTQGQCRDVYYNVSVQRTAAAYDTVQRYYVSVTSDQGATGTTPRPRQLYVEHLISQNRNDVTSLTGPTTVYVGETYTYTLVAKTATQGYEQLESFVTLDGVIFQVLSTTSTYTSPAGGTNDKLYADACGLQKDPTLANYKECVGPVQYAGGKAGGDIVVTYLVRVLSAGTTTLTPLIYDFSGSSYHYNSDFGDTINSLQVTALPPTADLSVTKTASTTTPTVGQNVTFTVTLNNGGPVKADNVQVRDLLPAGLTYVSSTASTGTYTPGTGIWDVPTIAGSTSQTLTITATVTSGGTVTNTAQVVASSASDPDSTPNNDVPTEDDQSSVTLTPPRADLSLTKTVDNAGPNVGQNVTFTVGVTNSGPATPATDVVVADPLPAGFSFVSATATSGTYSSATGLWTVGSVAVGTPQTLTLVATVTGPGPLTNTAQVQSASQLDPDSTAGNSNPAEDDQASVTVSPQSADLAVTKTASTLSPNVGQNVTFTVSVSNAGPNAATNLTVHDLLPAGLTFVSASASSGTYTSGTGNWFLANLASGGSATLTITAQVTATTAVSNTAQVQSVDQRDPDSTPGNSAAGEDDQATVTLTPQRADLSVTKTASTASPNVNDTITFTVTVANAASPTSNATATNVVVSDLLPAGATFVSATPSQGTYSSATGLWTVGSIPTGSSRTLTITATVTGSTSFTNTAQVQSVDQFDPDSTPGNSAGTEDDQSSVTVTPQRADLSLTTSIDNATPNVGSTVTYTVTVANAGPDAATGVTVLDQLPAGLTFVSSTPSQGTYDSATGVWTVGTIAAGGSATLQIQATVTSASALSNTAQVRTSQQFDPDSTPNNNAAGEDDQATVVATPQQADLSVTNVASAGTVNVGADATFTVSVTNAGPNAATGVVIADPVPAGTTYVSSSATSGAYDPGTGLWTVGTLASGSTATLTFVVRVDTAGTVTNTAQVRSVDQFDPDSTPNNDVGTEDDQGSASVLGVQADLFLTKTASTTTPNVGDTVTFTVTVGNNGPNTATGVAVLDLLPSGLTFSSATPSQGSYSSVTGVWTAGSIASGGSATLTITATVASSSPATNVAEITASDLSDPDSVPGNGAPAEDDRATVTITPRIADLSITNTVDDPTPNVGDTVTFTVTVTNVGPDAATAVTVRDLLPAGLTYVGSIPATGTYASGTGIWAVGTIAAGATATLTITATVSTASATTSTAQVQSSAVFDPDSTPGNNAAAEDDQASVSLTPQAADLSLTQIVSSPSVDVGSPVTFTVTLANAGPDTATDVVVTDLLPAGISFTSATPGAGSIYDSATGRWTVPSLPSGGSISLALTGTVTTAGTITNVASVTSGDQFDPDSTAGAPSPSEDDTAEASVTGRAADLRILKTAPASIAAGQPVTFTITVTNDGPSPATDVVISDPLPGNLGSPSSTTGGCAIASGTLTCTVASLAVGSTATATVTGTAPASGTIANSASVTSSTPDLDGTDNSSSTTVSVSPEADVSVTISAPPTVDAGQPLTYTITTSNGGPSTASSVVVTTPLPAGLSAPTTGTPGCAITGSPGAYTLTCTIGPLATDSSSIATVTGTAPADGTLTATSTVTASTADPDPSDNSATATTTVTPQADLSIVKSGPSAVTAGGTVIYTIGVSNGGPSTASAVVVTDTLPTALGSPSTSTPGCTITSGTLTCALGDLTSGGTTSITVTGTAPTTGTVATLSNTATATSATVDPDPADNSSTAITGIQPTVSIAPATTPEGDPLTFALTLSNPSTEDVAVTFTTSNGTATAGADYTPRTVTVVIPAGTTTLDVAVTTLEDTIDEADETVTATLTSATNATVSSTNGATTGTIADDDGAPTISVSDASADEGDTATFTITLSNPSASPVTVQAATADGTAIAGADYTSNTATVTIPAGQLSATFTVVTLEDATDEADETFVVNLSAPTGGAIADGQGAGTIVDDDGVPTISIAPTATPEGDTLTYDLSLSNPSVSAITVVVSTTPGTATAGVDYTNTTTTVTISAGATTATFSVATTEDTVDEADETVIATLSAPTNATISPTSGTAIGTIVDDDGAPSVSVSDASTSEGDLATFTLTLSNPSAGAITVPVTVASGTAVVGDDVAATTIDVTIPAGATTATFTVSTLEDLTDEPAETFSAHLGTPSGGATVADGTGVGTIVDDDGTPLVTIDPGPSVDEGTSATFTVRLSNPSSVPVTVTATTSAGTATSGTDFTATTVTVTIPAGATEATFTVATVEDLIDEADETFSVTLSAPSGADLGAATLSTGTIVDDDGTPTVSIDATTATEGSAAVFAVSLSNPSSSTVVVSFTTINGSATGGDYTSTTSTVTFAPGQTVATISIPTTPDAVDEADETFIVDLTGATNATVSTTAGDATGTILDDDGAPVISIADTSIGEGGVLTYTVTLSNPSASPVSVVVATSPGSASADVDYSTTTQTVTFPAGTTTATFTVLTTADTTDEPDETVTATLSSPTGGTVSATAGAATGTIVDDDGTPSLRVTDVTVVEGDVAHVTITVSNPSASDVTFDLTTLNGSAIAGTDYTETTTTVTIPAGATSVVVDVPTIEDPTDEPDETFLVATVGAATNATIGDDQGTVTITDDDGTPSISVADASTSEGGSLTFTLTLSNPSASPTTVSAATVPGTATTGVDFTALDATTVTFAPGTTTATVTVQTAQDPTDEPDETLFLELTAPTAATVADGTATGTIVDNDGVPTVSIAGDSSPEGSDVVFTVSLSNPSGTDVTVTLTTTSGTAIAGNDFTSTTTTITIPAGQTTATVPVPTTADSTDETDETFTVTLSSPTAATLGTASGIGTIVDDEDTVDAIADTATTPEGQATTVPVLVNDVDVDGGGITVVAVTQPPAGTGVVTINPDGTITYTPGADTNGTVTFTYTVEDSSGATDTATVTITVTPVNDGPVATPDAYPVAAGTTLTIAGPGVLGNDTDIDGDALTATLVTGPANGALTLNPDGSFTYTPNPGFSGTDTFTYTAGDGALTSAPVIVTLNVGGTPPVAADDSVTTGPDGSVTVPVLGNDADADGPLDPSRITIVSGPAHGTVEILTNGSIRYVAVPGYSGPDSLRYRICDAGGLCDEATLSVTVAGRVIAAPAPAPAAPLTRTGTDADRLVAVALGLLLLGTALVLASRTQRRSAVR